jgi:histidinol-phosphate/aromatic aminotransferase/cobyric acid decarboxylase-like protein
MGDVTMLGAVGALTSFKDKAHMEWERKENAEIKALVTKTFEDMGYEVPKSHTNHLFVNLKRPASEFREACLRQKSRSVETSRPWKIHTAEFHWEVVKR